MKIILLIFLLICAVTDFKTKKIPFLLLAGGILLTGGYFFWEVWKENREITDLIWALIPGILMLFTGFVTKGLGAADGLGIMITGLYFSPVKNISIVFTAFFLSAVITAILLACKKVKRKDKIPFLPFIFAAVCIVGYL